MLNRPRRCTQKSTTKTDGRENLFVGANLLIGKECTHYRKLDNGAANNLNNQVRALLKGTKDGSDFTLIALPSIHLGAPVFVCLIIYKRDWNVNFVPHGSKRCFVPKHI